jgi:hypothetical protein
MRGPSLVDYDRALTCYAPRPLIDAAAAGAAKRMTSISAYIRHALVEQLRRDKERLEENEVQTRDRQINFIGVGRL